MMFFNIYWHHTCRVCTVMFLRAIQDALLGGFITPAELERVDDNTLIALLQTRPASDSSSAELAARLNGRALYKRAFEYVADDETYALLAPLKRDAARRRALEVAWCELLSTPGRRLRGHEVLLDIPEQKAFRINMPILRRSGDSLVPGAWDRRDGLDDEIVAQLQRRLRRVRIVVADPDLREVARAREDEMLTIARDFAK
jgi:hypothetical protein